MIQELWNRFKAHDQRVTAFLDRQAKVESFGALVIMLALVVAAWAFAWYGHIIGPWMDRVLGLGPHDLDSAGKIRWRHIWSTAVCVPSIVVFVGLYILNVRDRIRYRKRFGKDCPTLHEDRRHPLQPIDTKGSVASEEKRNPSSPEQQQTEPPSLEQDWTKTVATTTVVMHTSPAVQWEDGGAPLGSRDGRVTLTIDTGNRSKRSSSESGT